jgi:hypothetical protein
MPFLAGNALYLFRSRLIAKEKAGRMASLRRTLFVKNEREDNGNSSHAAARGRKQGLLFLKKKKQKDFYESGGAP